jgi:hypothetical protein
MRTPKFSAKRVLGLTLATAIAVTGTVALATSSQAVTTPSATLTPATGSDSSATNIIVKGKGFADSTGAAVAKTVAFEATVCGVDATAGTAATSFNVVSATKIDVVAPTSLTAGTYYLCVWDGTTSTQVILGQGKFITNDPPTASTIAGAASNVAKASTLGGTTVSVTGANFAKTGTSATIDGLTTKSTYVSATKLSVTLPAHAAKTGLGIKVTTPYGSATTTDTITYTPVITVSPSSGDGTVDNVVTLTGTGFSALTFGAAATNATVVFIPGGTTLTANSTTLVSLHPCTSVVVESDTTVSCQAPVLSGAYSVAIVANGSTAADYGSNVSTPSKSSTYTAAAF